MGKEHLQEEVLPACWKKKKDAVKKVFRRAKRTPEILLLKKQGKLTKK